MTPRTNEERAAERLRQRVERGIYVTPLMQLGTTIHRDGWLAVPLDLLEEAMIHVERRLADLPDNHRGRSGGKWLGRWGQRIGAELERRYACRSHARR